MAVAGSGVHISVACPPSARGTVMVVAPVRLLNWHKAVDWFAPGPRAKLQAPLVLEPAVALSTTPVVSAGVGVLVTVVARTGVLVTVALSIGVLVGLAVAAAVLVGVVASGVRVFV